MKRWHVEILICPQCLPREVPLSATVVDQRQDEIEKGFLWCKRCGGEFPVIKGIPRLLGKEAPSNLYFEQDLISNYTWCHYSDLISQGSENPFLSYLGMFSRCRKFLDVGCGTGRLTLEMADKSELAVGLDLSHQMMEIAQGLLRGKPLTINVPVEGEIRERVKLVPKSQWKDANVLFLVADATNPPFPKSTFDAIASINLIDRVPNPAKLLKQMDRLLTPQDSQILVSDPFSWNETYTPKRNWLGGKLKGRFKGRGIQNLEEILTGKREMFMPPLRIRLRGSIEWELPHHKNRKEHIVSEFLLGER